MLLMYGAFILLTAIAYSTTIIAAHWTFNLIHFIDFIAVAILLCVYDFTIKLEALKMMQKKQKELFDMRKDLTQDIFNFNKGVNDLAKMKDDLDKHKKENKE